MSSDKVLITLIKQQQPSSCPLPLDYNTASKKTENGGDGNGYLPVLPVCFLTINSLIALFRAYDHRDLWMIIFVLFLYFGFMSLFICLREFDRLPQHEQSRKKEWLKVAIWVLTTSLNLGLAIKFAPLIYPVARVFILAMAISTSVCGFYFFFIYNDNNNNNNSQHKKHNKLPLPLPSETSSKVLKQSSSVPTTEDQEKIKSLEPLNMV